MFEDMILNIKYIKEHIKASVFRKKTGVNSKYLLSCHRSWHPAFDLLGLIAVESRMKLFVELPSTK